MQKCLIALFSVKRAINANLNMYKNDHLRMYTFDY